MYMCRRPHEASRSVWALASPELEMLPGPESEVPMDSVIDIAKMPTMVGKKCLELNTACFPRQSSGLRGFRAWAVEFRVKCGLGVIWVGAFGVQDRQPAIVKGFRLTGGSDSLHLRIPFRNGEIKMFNDNGTARASARCNT